MASMVTEGIVDVTSHFVSNNVTFPPFNLSSLFLQEGDVTNTTTTNSTNTTNTRTDNDAKMTMTRSPYDDMKLVGDDVIHVIEILLLTILCGSISACGLVTNVINVLVFLRQGALSSSSNVSLLALAFVDIGCLVPVFANSVNFALSFLGVPSIFLSPAELMDAAFIWPHIMCMQIASVITAYIALERCLCVLLPLKVKSMFTAERTAIVMVSISILVVLSFLPGFLTQETAKVTDPFTNATGIVSVSTEYHNHVMQIADMFHAIAIRPLTLLVVFVCTHITIYRVKLSTSWRKSVSSMAISGTSTTGAAATTTPPESAATTTSATVTVTSNSLLYHDDNNKLSNSKETIINTRSNVQDDDVRDVGDGGGGVGTTTATTKNINRGVSSCAQKDASGEFNTANDTTAQTKTTTKKSTTKNTTVTSTTTKKSSGGGQNAVTKETRLMYMITGVCTIFMVCNTPDIVGVLCIVVLKHTSDITPSFDIFRIMISVQLVMEAINSTVNILVYYRMSTSYRHAFRGLMGKR